MKKMLVIKCSICIWSVSCHSHCYIMHLSKIGVCPWLYRKYVRFSLYVSRSLTDTNSLSLSASTSLTVSFYVCLPHTHSLCIFQLLWFFFSLSNSNSNTNNNSLSLRKCRTKEDASSIKWREQQIVNKATHYVWEISKKSRKFKEIASRTEPLWDIKGFLLHYLFYCHCRSDDRWYLLLQSNTNHHK